MSLQRATDHLDTRCVLANGGTATVSADKVLASHNMLTALLIHEVRSNAFFIFSGRYELQAEMTINRWLHKALLLQPCFKNDLSAALIWLSRLGPIIDVSDSLSPFVDGG